MFVKKSGGKLVLSLTTHCFSRYNTASYLIIVTDIAYTFIMNKVFQNYKHEFVEVFLLLYAISYT